MPIPESRAAPGHHDDALAAQSLLDEPGQERNPVHQLEADFSRPRTSDDIGVAVHNGKRALQRLPVRDVFISLPTGAMERVDSEVRLLMNEPSQLTQLPAHGVETTRKVCDGSRRHRIGDTEPAPEQVAARSSFEHRLRALKRVRQLAALTEGEAEHVDVAGVEHHVGAALEVAEHAAGQLEMLRARTSPDARRTRAT